jgi:hypothetical protein
LCNLFYDWPRIFPFRSNFMAEYAELEIGLHRRDSNSYAVELRFSQPESDADIRVGLGQPIVVEFDLSALRAKSLDAAAYGQALAGMLFADPALQTAFAQARTSAQSLDVPLRVRLLIGPSAMELHSLRWETLRDPQTNEPLFTGENVFLSRYLSSLDWRPVRAGGSFKSQRPVRLRSGADGRGG